jgi:hypothetical protein
VEKAVVRRSKASPAVRQAGALVPDWKRSHGQQEVLLMTLESHLAELERRHEALEKEIEEALSHPGTDTLVLADLKKRKLQLKDEIVRLKSTAVH